MTGQYGHYGYHGFLSQGRALARLDDLIVGSKLRLVSPLDINNAGQIVGYTVKDNVRRALLLTPVDFGNQAPTAQALDCTTGKGAPVKFTLPVRDSDSDVVVCRIVKPPENGSVRLTGTAAVYVPDEGGLGTDTFTYIALDGWAASEPATVTIRVKAPVPVPAEGTVRSGR